MPLLNAMVIGLSNCMQHFLYLKLYTVRSNSSKVIFNTFHYLADENMDASVQHAFKRWGVPSTNILNPIIEEILVDQVLKIQVREFIKLEA